MGLPVDLNRFCSARLYQRLCHTKQRFKRLWSSAYIIPSFGAKTEVCSKHYAFAQALGALVPKLQQLAEHIQTARSSDTTFRIIKKTLPFVGDFLGYQICVDLGYAMPHLYDDSAHVVAGPGCKKGLQLLFYPAIGPGRIHPTALIQYLVHIQGNYLADLSLSKNASGLFKGRRLNLMAVENCLCEISKYIRCLHGGRAKNSYPGGKGPCSCLHLLSIHFTIGTTGLRPVADAAHTATTPISTPTPTAISGVGLGTTVPNGADLKILRYHEPLLIPYTPLATTPKMNPSSNPAVIPQDYPVVTSTPLVAAVIPPGMRSSTTTTKRPSDKIGVPSADNDVQVLEVEIECPNRMLALARNEQCACHGVNETNPSASGSLPNEPELLTLLTSL